MTAMITVDEAVEAYFLRAVATLTEHGQRVWWKRCPWFDDASNGHSFAYWMAVNDDEHEVWFEPVYHGNGLDDLVPEGFDDFTLFIDGGKFEVDLLIDHDTSPGAPMNVRSRREIRDDEGRLLEFVARLPVDDGTVDWLALPDIYLRCSDCSVENEVIVAVADPDEECLCGALSRNPDGTLQVPDETRCFTAVYRIAQE